MSENAGMTVRAYAPACIGNFAAGFDLLGAALAPLDGSLWGDVVQASMATSSASAAEPSSLSISGPFAAQMPADPGQNLVLQSYRLFRQAVEAKGLACPPLAFHLTKNLPRCSGLGSSASSVAATLVACQHLLGEPLSLPELFAVAGRAEGFVSGAVHLDNVVPILVGGLQLMVPGRDGAPEARSLPWPDDLVLVLLAPAFELATASSRQVLPRSFTLAETLAFAENLAGFVHALTAGDRELLGRCLRDVLTEPHRAALVPGFRAVQAAALASGALGCGLSGSGPAIFAVAHSPAHGEEVGEAMRQALESAGLASTVRLCGLDHRGARVLA
ncbi:MAG: homoserine kinase [Acidobacteriota bacterium]|jgi:homoserine kinase|nr:homoserine kinase [Acidobacteriota bacterium]